MMDPAYHQIAADAFPVHEFMRIRFRDIDGQNIVYNSHYLSYADIGVTEYFRILSRQISPAPVQNYAFNFMVAHVEGDYHASARLDDIIDIAARLVRLGRTSLVMHCGIFRKEEAARTNVTGTDSSTMTDSGTGKSTERLCDIALTLVYVDLDSGKPTPLPKNFVTAARRIEPTPPLLR